MHNKGALKNEREVHNMGGRKNEQGVHNKGALKNEREVHNRAAVKIRPRCKLKRSTEEEMEICAGLWAAV